jgi:hypothetical protein
VALIFEPFLKQGQSRGIQIVGYREPHVPVAISGAPDSLMSNRYSSALAKVIANRAPALLNGMTQFFS